MLSGIVYNLKRFFRRVALGCRAFYFGSEEKHQALLAHAFFYSGSLIGLFYGIHSWINGYLITAAVVLSSVLVLCFFLILSTIRKQQQIAVVGGIVSYGLLSIVLLITGGVDNTGALWAYPFPVVAVSWLDRKQSVFAIAIFFLVAATVLILPGDMLVRATYSENFRFRFLGSFFLVCLSSYLVERTSRLNRQKLTKEIKRRKKTQAMLVRALHEAKHASKAKSTFLANMSHELRTPLGSIIGLTDLIGQAELEEPYREYVRSARFNADLLLAIINDILDLSKIEADKLELVTIEFEMHRVVEEIAGALSSPAFDKGLDLACLIKRDVPDRLIGDPSRLRQILVNLTSNAIKFTHQGKITLEVTLEDKQRDYSVVRFQVTDTGIGIPGDMLGSLFDSFSQVDTSTTRRYGGTGLGLAICRRLVELMGGSIGVMSRPGVGSTFWFTARFESAEKPEITLPHFFTFDGVKLLGISHDQLSMDIVREGLARTGCEIETTTDYGRFSSMLEQSSTTAKPYDAIIAEAKSPSLNLVKIGAQIRHWCPQQTPKMILIISQGEIIDPTQMEEWGVLEYVVKPIKVTALRKAIGRSIGKIEPDDQSAQRYFIPVYKPLAVNKGSTNGHVLIVEDNASLRTVVRKYLSDFNLPCHEVTNGMEALDLLRKENYLLVLMDIQMPELDGIQTACLIRDKAACAKNHLTPIIAMTAHSQKGDKERFLQLGMNDYIPKPIRQEELYTVIARQLSIRVSLTPRPPASLPPPVSGGFEPQDLLERQGYDVEFCRGLVRDFLAEMPRRIEAVAQNITHVEVDALRREAHSLKGIAHTAGAGTLGNLCHELETVSQVDLPRVCEQLKSAMDVYQHQALQWLAKGDGERF